MSTPLNAPGSAQLSPAGFAGMIALSLVLSLLAAVLDMVWPGLLPPQWQALLQDGGWGAEAVDPQASLLLPLLGVAALLAYLVLALVAAVAMARLRRWGRSVSLWLSVLGIPLVAVLGPMVLSGWAYMLQAAGTVLWGAALAAAYWSPLAARFEARA